MDFKIKISKLINQGGGFTLLETIVAIGIIVVALVSSLGVITNSVYITSNFQDRLVAANLAAEGVEVIRNIRDNNWLQSLNWKTGLADGDYEVTYSSLSLTPYIDRVLKMNPMSGLYDYSLGSQDTIFKRKITITNLSNYEMRVVSMVTWQRRASAYSISIEDHLFNWK